MTTTNTTIYTAFCQDANGTGTIWIDTVHAKSLAHATVVARSKCAADWECAFEDVHCLGIAEGEVKILHWEDLND